MTAGDVTTITPISAAFLLFMIMDPFGNVPIFLAALKDVPTHRRARIVVREMLIALGILLLFLLTGGFILGALGITTTSVAIAGGVLLMVIAIRMVFPSPHGILGEEPSGEPFIVPLAVPLTAGPSAIAMVMLFMSTEPERWAAWIGSVVAAWLPAAAILAGSGVVSRVLGRRGLIAIERLFGMLLVAIAVQILINGVMPLVNGA